MTTLAQRTEVVAVSAGTGVVTSHVEVYDALSGTLVQRIELPIEVSALAIGHDVILATTSTGPRAIVAWTLPRQI
jgi:hypothetical protein